MFRWFSAFFALSVCLLALIIWNDARQGNASGSDEEVPEHTHDNSPSQTAGEQNFRSSPAPDEFETHHQPGTETDETYFDFHGGVDFDDADAIVARIDTLEQALLAMEGENARQSRAAIPYYGELILLYNRLGRADGAAEASRHIAMIAEDPQDWWNAAAYFRQWAQQSGEQSVYEHYMNRAAGAYRNALESSDDAALKTDYAITLLALEEENQALNILEELIEQDTSLYRPFLYAGMILYEKGKKNESIAYIRRSVEKAASTAERDEITSMIQQTSIEI